MGTLCLNRCSYVYVCWPMCLCVVLVRPRIKNCNNVPLIF